MKFLHYFSVLKLFCATNVNDEQTEISEIQSSSSTVNNTTSVSSHANKRKISEYREQSSNPKYRHSEIQINSSESYEYPSNLSEKLDDLLLTKLHNCLCDPRFELLISLHPTEITKNKLIFMGISEKIFQFFAKKGKSRLNCSKITEIIYKLLGYPYNSMHEAAIFLTLLTLHSSCFKGLTNGVLGFNKRQYDHEPDAFKLVSCYTIHSLENAANQWIENEGKNFDNINLVVINQCISYLSNDNDLYTYKRVCVNEFIELFSDICEVVLKYK